MFPKPKTENKCMCMFETNEKTCAYKRSYNRAVLQSVFFFRLSDIVTVWRVYIDALLQPYSKHLPINKKLPLKYFSRLLSVLLRRGPDPRVLWGYVVFSIWLDWMVPLSAEDVFWASITVKRPLKLRNSTLFTEAAFCRWSYFLLLYPIRTHGDTRQNFPKTWNNPCSQRPVWHIM